MLVSEHQTHLLLSVEIYLQHLKVTAAHTHALDFLERPLPTLPLSSSVFLPCFVSSYSCDDPPSS